MNRQKTIVLAASSDSWRALAAHFFASRRRCRRNLPQLIASRMAELGAAGTRLFPVDITSAEQVLSFAGAAQGICVLMESSLVSAAGDAGSDR